MKKSSETERILELIKKLKEQNIPVIVEGPKDKKTLEKLGLTNVTQLSKKPIYEITEKIAEKTKETAILTDLDPQGRKLYHKLSEALQKQGVKINDELRKELFKARISHIEGLDTYILHRINYTKQAINPAERK